MINKIRENLNKVLKDINRNFEEKEKNADNEPYHPWDDDSFYEDIDDPYEGASWGPAKNWFCIRCGHHLKEMNENDPVHGEACFSAMRCYSTLYYQCSNDKCFHHTAPLLLHHPIYGCESPAGDSYSISWIK
jgi:hypothetical protein